jgi:predicted nucleotidyltransferase
MGQETVRSILLQFKKTLESNHVPVDQLILFGSHALNAGRDDSDIDVVVISESFKNKDYWERIDILTEAIYQIFAPIEASAFTPEEWKAGTSLIADYAKDGVVVN